MRDELLGDERWIVAEGTYGDGSEGNPDAALLVDALEAALARGEAVVVDLRAMHYGFGDAIGGLFWGALGQPVRLLLQAECEPAYEGLLRYLGGPAEFGELRERIRYE